MLQNTAFRGGHSSAKTYGALGSQVPWAVRTCCVRVMCHRMEVNVGVCQQLWHCGDKLPSKVAPSVPGGSPTFSRSLTASQPQHPRWLPSRTSCALAQNFCSRLRGRGSPGRACAPHDCMQGPTTRPPTMAFTE